MIAKEVLHKLSCPRATHQKERGDTFFQNLRDIALSFLSKMPYFFKESYFALKVHVNFSTHKMSNLFKYKISTFSALD